MKKIYKTRPLHYRQWRQIRKEAMRLAVCVAALVALDAALQVGAAALIHLLYGL